LSSTPAWSGKQVLLVENHDQLRELWERLLKSWGYQVTAIASADDALQILSGGKLVDLLLSDIRLPGRLSGLDLAYWVKQHRPEVAIILQTGSDERFPREFRVLLKPIHPEELKRCLLELLANQR